MQGLKKIFEPFNEGEKMIMVIAVILILISMLLYSFIDKHMKNVSEINTSVEEETLTLVVENKFENYLLSYLPIYYYIKLSNGYYLSLSKEEYAGYEVGKEYEFVLVNEMKSTTYLKH